MFSKEDLQELNKRSIESGNPNELKELTEIQMDNDVPIEERIEKFFKQIQNPYHFLVNGVPVQIAFNNHNNNTLDSCFYNYLIEKRDSKH